MSDHDVTISPTPTTVTLKFSDLATVTFTPEDFIRFVRELVDVARQMQGAK